jgi:DegV family protein with EDD domain
VAAEGGDLAAVVARAGEMIPRVNLVVTMDTLEYLYRGGRIGWAAQLMGSALQFKPILSVGNGVVDALERPRTQAKAVRHILEIMAARVGERPVHAAVVHADAFNKAEWLRQEVASRFNCRELYVTDLTPVMGTHTGPGVLGMAWWSEEEGASYEENGVMGETTSRENPHGKNRGSTPTTSWRPIRRRWRRPKALSASPSPLS